MTNADNPLSLGHKFILFLQLYNNLYAVLTVLGLVNKHILEVKLNLYYGTAHTMLLQKA